MKRLASGADPIDEAHGKLPIQPRHADTLQQVARYAEATLVPGTAKAIGSSIARLFNHYPPKFSPDGLPEERARQMLALRQQVKEDWMEDMAEYPAWVVDEACKRWRRGPKGMFQPSISDIRTLCADVMAPVIKAKYQSNRLASAARKKAELDAYAEAERRKAWGI